MDSTQDSDLVKFPEKEVDKATDPFYGKPNSLASPVPEVPRSKFKGQGQQTTASFVIKAQRWPPCAACGFDHRIIFCEKFKQMTPAGRVKLVHDNRLCENCLHSNHETKDCRNSSTCTVTGCGRKHSKLLRITQSLNSVEEPSRFSISNANVHLNTSNGHSKVKMPVCSVKVMKCQTTVLLDSGSTHTFCTREFISYVGITGKPTK